MFDKVKKMLEAERRVRELESTSERLVMENTDLGHELIRYEKRVAALEAALGRLADLSRPLVCGGHEVGIFRSCKAILEDESWKR